MNTVQLTGRLAKDPELRHANSGTAVANITVAVDRQAKDAPADFVPITAFGKVAEAVAQYTTKGYLVSVEGRIQVRSWDTDDGERHWRTEVIANRIEFLKAPKAKADNAPAIVEDTDVEPF